MKRIRTLTICLFSICLTLGIFTPEASAQQGDEGNAKSEAGGSIEPSEGQKTLNDEGVQALIAKEYERAVALLNESLALGELNITYLNLGRAYQKLGQCVEAQKAYLNAVSAPAVKEPAQRIVDAKADQYLEELKQECGDELDTEPTFGEQPGVQYGLIGGGAAVAAFGAFALLRGASLRPGEGDFERNNEGVIVEPSHRDAFEARDKANTWTTIGISAVTVGAVAAGIGTYFLVTDDSMESQPTAGIGPDGSWQLGWSVRF
ncbi:MAG: hypothetical protein ACQEVA_15310 [Myxococcota bacterium]